MCWSMGVSSRVIARLKPMLWILTASLLALLALALTGLGLLVAGFFDFCTGFYFRHHLTFAYYFYSLFLDLAIGF